MHINWAHVHLMINHFPVVGIFFVQAVLLCGLVRKKNDFTVFSFALFIALALIAGVVFWTGDGAEDVAKKLPEVSERLIANHEDAADVSLTLLSILGSCGIAGLFFNRRNGAIPKWLVIVVLIVSLAADVSVGITAYRGGLIRHTEIR
jgi:hypothetical protein